MALTPGSRFGCYEVAGEIGAGGMGVVYRATDTNLKRDVAIKVLPESLAEDEERLTRFQREAELLASLNHPNIAQIYGLERSDGRTALIMELVEGPTLEDRIKRGPLAPDDALGLAMQITTALEAAHGQGIVHRDLKPANIKLGSDGTLKVLDFGIAKALAPDVITSAPQSPVMTTPATQVGVILGTAAYMSPEQAKGKFVDQRTDVWAFGCLLYEMLTGQMAFGAEDVPTTLARVIDRDTDLDTLPATVSLAVRRTIQLCLQKDVGKRVADIRDVRLALEGAFDTVSPHAADATRPPWHRAVPLTAAVLVTGIVVGGAAWFSLQPEPPPIDRFAYELPGGQSLRNTARRVLAVSPDGRNFVYNATGGLYVRPMDELEARLIPGTEVGVSSPSFLADGQVAYWSFLYGQLQRVAISGGATVQITDLDAFYFGMSQAADGMLYFAQEDGIYRVAATGGTPELLIQAEESTRVFGPQLLPDGDTVLFSLVGGILNSSMWDRAEIVAQSLTTGERTTLIEGGADARYLPTGHLVYALGNGLFGVAFDAETLTVSGGAVPLVQGVMRAVGEFGSAAANYAISDEGTLVYTAGTSTTETRTLVWLDRQGGEEPLDVPPRNYASVRISPDGTKLALDVRDQELDIWTWDLARQTLSRVTFDSAEDEQPIWSPDSQRIAFSSSRDGGSAGDTSLYWRMADGTGTVERLAEGSGQVFPTSFSADGGAVLVYGGSTGGGGGNDDIGVFRPDGESTVTPLLASDFQESYPAMSPDGRWFAYVSDESGSEQVYVRPFPDVDAGRWQVSTAGGTQPIWSPAGGELFYRDGPAMMAVTIQSDPTFVAGTPELLFEDDYVLEQGGPNYAVSMDGERFLMIHRVGDDAETPKIIIVQNWFEELERLVPTE